MPYTTVIAGLILHMLHGFHAQSSQRAVIPCSVNDTLQISIDIYFLLLTTRISIHLFKIRILLNMRFIKLVQVVNQGSNVYV